MPHLDLSFFSLDWGGDNAGGQIFDDRLLQTLSYDGEVRVTKLGTDRAFGLPIWARKVRSAYDHTSVGLRIVSHEGLYKLLDKFEADCFIVHNYFSEFEYPGNSALQLLYRAGSGRVFRKIFSSSRTVMFLSAREMRLASNSYPEFSEKFFCCPPGFNGSRGFFAGARNPNVIDVPGSTDWLPKRISFSRNIDRGVGFKGELIRAESDNSYISIIYDSFLSGFKLKLTEMVRHGKCIISFADLEEELRYIGYGDLPYVFIKSKQELLEAVSRFRNRGDLSDELRRQFFERSNSISWSAMAKKIVARVV